MGLTVLLVLFPAGLLVSGSSGSGTLPVGIVSSANPADAGLRFELVAKVTSPEDPLVYNWTDSLGGSSNAPTWELTVDVPGNLTVTLDVTDITGDRGVATLTLTIRPSPSLTVTSPLIQVDAGIPAPVFIRLVGGVPPFTANWTPAGGAPGGNASWPTDGNFSEEASFSVPGPGWIAVHVVDFLGDPASADEVVTEVEPRGAVTLAANGSVGEVGLPVGIAAGVGGGAPPFQWSLASSLPIVGAGTVGIFPSDGMFRWNLSFAFSGIAALNLTAIDATGALQTATTAITVEPALFVEPITPSVQPITPFDFAVNLSGGLAPYAYEFRLSDGEGYDGTLPSPGSLDEIFDPPPDGNYSVEVRVTDSLGQTSIYSGLIRVSGPGRVSTDPPRSDYWAAVGIIVLTVTVLVGAAYAYHRLRRSPGPPAVPGNSALPVVRQLMRQSQIIDRETLLLLCEEAGESGDAVQSALQTLLRTGEVSTEPGPANDQVLRWNEGNHRELDGDGSP